MRIKKLNLLRYGHFGDHELDFPETGLTIVYGPNETGKSTSLSAISDLLYGFGHTTDFDFRYGSLDLRIGATLENRAGDELSFVRRKGRSKTVRAEDESVLPDSSLSPFLGRSQRDLFEKSFGLSHKRLRDGGNAIAGAEGDLGKILFEAGSGISNITAIQTMLDEEADGIFGSRKKASRVLYQSLEDYDCAASELKAALLKRQDWLNAEKDQTDAEVVLEDARGALRDLRTKQSQLNRWQRVLPILRELDSLQDSLRRLGDLVNLPDDARERHTQAVEQRRHGDDYIKQETEHLEESLRRIEECAVDIKLLDARDSIQALFQRVAGIEEQIADVPVVENDLGEIRNRITAQADRLNLPMDDDQPAMPKQADLTEMAELVQTKQTLDADMVKVNADQATNVVETEDLKNELAALGDVTDPRADTAVFQKLRTTFAALGDDKGLARNLRTHQKKIGRLISRLSWWNGTSEELVDAKLPSLAVIDKYRKSMDQSEKVVESSREKYETVKDELAAAKHALTDYREREDFCSNEDVSVARGQREDAWRIVKQTLDGNPPETKELARFDAGNSLESVYENLTARADEAADGRLDSIEKVVQHDRLEKEVASKEQAVEALERKLSEAAAKHETLAKEWATIWRKSDITPLSPAEMREAMGDVDAILEASVAADKLTDEMTDLHELTESALAKLHELADRVMPAGCGDADADESMALIETALDDRSRIYSAAAELRTRSKEHERFRDKYQRSMGDLETRVTAWESKWEACCKRISIDPKLTMAQANETIDTWEGLVHKIADGDRVQGELSKSRLVIEQFVESVRALVKSLQYAAETESPEDAVACVRKLHSDHLEMQRVATRRTELEKQKDEREASIEKQNEAMIRAVGDIKMLMELAGVDSESELTGSITKAEEQRSVKLAMEGARGRLTEAGDGESEGALREMSADVVFDSLAAELSEMSVQLESLERDREEAARGEEHARAALESLKAKAGAPEQAQLMQNAVAKMNTQTRDYLRAKAASILLRIGIERIRDKHKSPILLRAGKLFTIVTGGSYGDLAIDYDQKDNPTIVGLRPSGERVHVNQMSVGTRDQLYLSLRLAFVESYCATEEPLPFIGDDIFVDFDDKRTTAGLKLLASMENTQVIVFTHHQHLQKLAVDALGDRVGVLNMSGERVAVGA